jgi:CheY-like chemotaxis protein
VTTVLVVDDESHLRKVVAEALRDEGYAVVTAADGRAAVEVFAREVPDLVLMDVMMPGLDGPAAYLVMRGHPHGEVIPIVLMSAAADPTHLAPGVSAFVRKPFDLERLLGLVVRLVDPADAAGHESPPGAPRPSP